MQRSNTYTILFAAAVCLVCAIFVSGAAVALKPLQEANKRLDVQKKVLNVSGAAEGEKLNKTTIPELFEQRIRATLIDLETGKPVEGADATDFDQKKATKDPKTSRSAPKNSAGIPRVPYQAVVYEWVENEEVKALVLPIEGKGLWSTLYGFIALDKDTTTIKGITFYQHGETPGLGGEIDNPRWKALWADKKVFAEGDFSSPKIEVVKGQADRNKPEAQAHHIDGLAGATITSRGVGNLVQFWMGEKGFGPYLTLYRGDEGGGS